MGAVGKATLSPVEIASKMKPEDVVFTKVESGRYRTPEGVIIKKNTGYVSKNISGSKLSKQVKATGWTVADNKGWAIGSGMSSFPSLEAAKEYVRQNYEKVVKLANS